MAMCVKCRLPILSTELSKRTKQKGRLVHEKCPPRTQVAKRNEVAAAEAFIEQARRKAKGS